jgi:hypothetical protein
LQKEASGNADDFPLKEALQPLRESRNKRKIDYSESAFSDDDEDSDEELDEDQVANKMFKAFNKAKPLTPEVKKQRRVMQSIDLVSSGAMLEMVEHQAKEQKVVIDLTEKKHLLFVDIGKGHQVVTLGPDSINRIASMLNPRSHVFLPNPCKEETPVAEEKVN